jgi:hypothetical protein
MRLEVANIWAENLANPISHVMQAPESGAARKRRIERSWL